MDIQAIRAQFPVTRLTFPVLGEAEPRPLIYFDHGASTHPPRPVLDAHQAFMERYYANIHRANHNLSLIATQLFENVARVIAGFIGADLQRGAVLLTQNTTAALDLASHIMASQPGGVLTTVLEHHSNDLPHRQRGVVHHVAVSADGHLDLADLEARLRRERVKLVAVTGASNVTGLMPPIHRIAALAHEHGAKILVDAAQLLAHCPLDVRPDDDPEHLDFVAAAGHKAYAPFGSAFLYGPQALMNAAPPYLPGGGTATYVSEEEVVWSRTPDRLLGGTPNIAGGIAFAAALQFLQGLGMAAVREHELELLRYACRGLAAIEGVTLYGPPQPEERIGVVTFNIRGVSHALVAGILNYEAGIATRNGRFCAHPYIHRLLGIADPSIYRRQTTGCGSVELPGAVRATFGVYNTLAEVEQLVAAVGRIARREWQGRYVEEPGVLCRPLQLPVDSRDSADWLLAAGGAGSAGRSAEAR